MRWLSPIQMIGVASVLTFLTTSLSWAVDPIFPLGLHVGITPPSGMVPSKRRQGFEDVARQAIIVINERPAEAYPSIEEAFRLEELKARGIDAVSREDVDLNVGRGFLVVAKQEFAGGPVRKWTLVALAGEVTAIVAAQVPEAARATYPDNALREALMSLTVRAKVPEDENLALLPYALSELDGFTIVRALTDGTVFLTFGPKLKASPGEQPFLVIGNALGQTPPPAEWDSFARRLLGSTPAFKELHFVRSELLRIGGQQGHEVIGEAVESRTNTEVMVVQWLRFGTAGYIQMVGIASKDMWASMLPRMRAVRDGLKPK